MDSNDFLCPKCGGIYPLVAQTTRGTCAACGAAGRMRGSRKSAFLKREQHATFFKNAISSHKANLQKNLDS